MPPLPPDDENGSDDDNSWGHGRQLNRVSVESIRNQLASIAQAQREMKREMKSDIERLRDVVNKDVESGNERTFMIRRVDERLNDLFARFVVVEQRYINKEDHEKALAPFKKWGSWIAMLVIGGVVTAIMALVLGKGAGH